MIIRLVMKMLIYFSQILSLIKFILHDWPRNNRKGLWHHTYTLTHAYRPASPFVFVFIWKREFAQGFCWHPDKQSSAYNCFCPVSTLNQGRIDDISSRVGKERNPAFEETLFKSHIYVVHIMLPNLARQIFLRSKYLNLQRTSDLLTNSLRSSVTWAYEPPK